MRAQPGDWIVVHSISDSRASRRAVILTVSVDGAPPYRVRWTDSGHEGLLFPGANAEVVTASRVEERDLRQAERAVGQQPETAAH